MTSRKKRRPSRKPSPSAESTERWGTFPVACILVFLIAAAAANTGPIANNDYGMHLRVGQETLESKAPPRTDHHSHTRESLPYPDHEWLIQPIFYGLQKLLDDGGMVALKGLLIAAALGCVILATPGPLVLRLATATAAMLLGLHHSHMRPHLFSWLFAALLMLLLQRGWHKPVPLLLLVWANCHGSIALGVGMAGLYFLERFWENRKPQELVWAAVCGIVPLINPNVHGIYTLFFEISGHTEFIGEWKPYTPESGAFWLLCILIGATALAVLAIKPFSAFDLLRLAVFGFLAFQSSRNGIVAAIFLAPVVGRKFAPMVSGLSLRVKQIGSLALIAVAVVCLVVRSNNGNALQFRMDHQRLPVAAVDFIKRHRLTGPIFNDYNFGGYLLWKAWPEIPVFLDGRTEVYKGAVLDDYLHVSSGGPDWENIVRSYKVRFFLVRPERSVCQMLLRHPAWDLVYFDYNSAIYVRKDLFPDVMRLNIVSPYGHRDRSRIQEAAKEMTYLVGENPLFFGGYKILAYLLHRGGDHAGAARCMRKYLELNPKGTKVDDTKELLEALGKRGVWP